MSAADQNSGQGARVLVVDDTALMRLYYRQTLEAAGFEVVEAGNGIEALERLAEAPAALVVVDINMPKMDGIAFLYALRNDPLLAALPAVVVSTESQSHDMAEARRAGANFYLTKPAAADQLVLFATLLSGRAP